MEEEAGAQRGKITYPEFRSLEGELLGPSTTHLAPTLPDCEIATHSWAECVPGGGCGVLGEKELPRRSLLISMSWQEAAALTALVVPHPHQIRACRQGPVPPKADRLVLV